MGLAGTMLCKDCCGEGTVECLSCPGGAPYRLRVDISGLEDVACVDCSSLNGTYILTPGGVMPGYYPYSACHWRSGNITPCTCYSGFDHYVLGVIKYSYFPTEYLDVAFFLPPTGWLVYWSFSTTGSELLPCTEWNGLAVPLSPGLIQPCGTTGQAVVTSL
jgi:hypothetical protein